MMEVVTPNVKKKTGTVISGSLRPNALRAKSIDTSFMKTRLPTISPAIIMIYFKKPRVDGEFSSLMARPSAQILCAAANIAIKKKTTATCI
jgi:hypothetical protein